MCKGKFELITGPMSCGKTEELLRRIVRCRIANKKVAVYSPTCDTREVDHCVKSRNGISVPSTRLNADNILDTFIKSGSDVLALDEIQFFSKEIVEVVQELIYSGFRVIGAGLDLDYNGQPFGNMPELMCVATNVIKLQAVCMRCGSDYATRTQLLTNVQDSGSIIQVGGDESYEARCIDCHIPILNSRQNKQLVL